MNIQKRKFSQQKVKSFSNNLKFKLVHQLNSIYQGNINSSYHKEGFGIQQTSDFQTYIGYWKNNKAEGLGLIIYPSGCIIYGNFTRDQLNGVAITDDHQILRCGIFSNLQLIGIGFQYQYQNKVWRMSRFHKGLPIQIIKQQKQVKQGIVPKLINIQQSLFNHLSNYLSKRFFVDNEINQAYYHQISPLTQYYGLLSENNSAGLGVFVEKKKIKQIGFYEEGLLNGFGIRSDYQIGYSQLGFYCKGKKQGLFFQRKSNKQSCIQYKRDKQISNQSSQSIQVIKKKQKKHNFQCKDFLSLKSTLSFQNLQNIFISPEIRAYNMRKKLQQQQQKNHLPSYKKTQKSQHNQQTNSNQSNQNKKSSGNSNTKQKNYYIVEDNNQKSSLQSVKEKMGSYLGVLQLAQDIKKSPQKKKNYPYAKQKQIINNNNKQQKEKQQQSYDQIAEQENPITDKLEQTLRYKRSIL